MNLTARQIAGCIVLIFACMSLKEQGPMWGNFVAAAFGFVLITAEDD